LIFKSIPLSTHVLYSCIVVRTESKCFDYLNHKKIHPKDIYHDPKYKSNPFVIDDLGIIKSKITSMAENMSKYKLPLHKQIEIRL
jgi:hypothetical protein